MLPLVSDPATSNSASQVVSVSKRAKEIVPSPILAQDLPRKEFPLSGNLRALSVVSPEVVWVSGSEGHVFRTVNRGAEWLACPIEDSKADFRALHAFNALEACTACAGKSEDGNALVYRTHDGGETWQRVLTIEAPGFFINGMTFWDADHGILLCDPVDGVFRFFVTNDGGCTWQLVDSNIQLQSLPGEALFAASNTCMTVHGESKVWFATGGGEVARVFHSEDRGGNWEVVETPITCTSQLSGVFSLDFRTPLEGIAVGGDYEDPSAFSSANCIITQDGGRNWQPLSSEAFSEQCLFCAAWNEGQPFVVEGSSRTFHTVVPFEDQLWLAGPEKVALVTNST